MTPDQIKQYQSAILKALSSNPDVAKYGGTNTVDSILDAYTTNDWSGVIDITGKPFTNAQQKDAVKQAEKALAPAYNAQESYDQSIAQDALRGQQEDFGQFQKGEAKQFGLDKDAQDQNSADQGVLFSGSRVQKLNDLRTTYQDRENIARGIAQDNIRNTARSNQYKYGDQSANKLSGLYDLAGTTSFNPNIAGGGITRGGLSSSYNTGDFKFQGTAPVAHKAAVQTRAAGLLANRANKLTSTGYKNQF